MLPVKQYYKQKEQRGISKQTENSEYSRVDLLIVRRLYLEIVH